jgi:hemolysin-activating ACP:hemolysin acyltransferase
VADKSKNGSANKVKATDAAPAGGTPVEAGPPEQFDPEVVKKLAAVRSHVRESFGNVVMTMMLLPRYRHQSLGDLQHLVLEPLIRDRIAIAYPRDTQDNKLADMAGLAIWASVSDAVDAKIREQINAGVFPIRLQSEDWTSGDNNWLLDVIAPDAKTTAAVIANFRQLVKEGGLKLHPLVTRLVDPETLKRMGATRAGATEPAAAPETEPAD